MKLLCSNHLCLLSHCSPCAEMILFWLDHCRPGQQVRGLGIKCRGNLPHFVCFSDINDSAYHYLSCFPWYRWMVESDLKHNLIKLGEGKKRIMWKGNSSLSEGEAQFSIKIVRVILCSSLWAQSPALQTGWAFPKEKGEAGDGWFVFTSITWGLIRSGALSPTQPWCIRICTF